MIVTYQKPIFEGKCTDCGNATTVPFKPTPGKPVYCRTCFSKHMTNRSEIAGSNKVLPRSKRGHGEEIIGKETKRLAILVCFNGLTAHKTRKLFRKR